MKRIPVFLIVAFGLTVAAGLSTAQDDRHVNPEPDEDYMVRCYADSIEIWDDSQPQQLLVNIPILSIMQLAVGNELRLDIFLRLTRETEDDYVLTGTRPEAPKHKRFTLSECLERNGRTPLPPAAADPPESFQAPGGTSPGEPKEYDLPENATGEDNLWWLLRYFCGLPVGGFGLVAVPFVSRRRRARRGSLPSPTV